MRKALLATLALSPVLLHAQANSPAQPKNTLESRLSAPKELEAAGDRAAAIKPLRVSTGVVAPKLIQSFDIPLDSSATGYTGPRTVVIDKSVLAAVSQYRFKPGTVSNQPIAIPLNLEVNLVSTVR
jgi:hypothetical protein